MTETTPAPADPDALRPLSDINPATGSPWRCITHEAHQCAGPVVGAVGAIPVCKAGRPAEVAARVADRERIAGLMAQWQADGTLAREIAAEAAYERAANRY